MKGREWEDPSLLSHLPHPPHPPSPHQACSAPRLSLTLHTHHHAAPQPQHQVQRALLLDVVIGQGAAVLELLAGKDQALLVRGDACEIAGR